LPGTFVHFRKGHPCNCFCRFFGLMLDPSLEPLEQVFFLGLSRFLVFLKFQLAGHVLFHQFVFISLLYVFASQRRVYNEEVGRVVQAQTRKRRNLERGLGWPARSKASTCLSTHCHLTGMLTLPLLCNYTLPTAPVQSYSCRSLPATSVHSPLPLQSGQPTEKLSPDRSINHATSRPV